MKADLVAIKARLASPVEVARLLGLRVEAKQRNGILTRCPIHNNKSGSLSLRTGRDGTLQVKCHGCDLAGDILTLLEAVEGGFKAALKRAESLSGVAPPFVAPPPDPPRMPADRYHALAETILKTGRIQLRSDPVRRYLYDRHILDAAIAEGWASLPDLRTLDASDLIAARLLRDDPPRGLSVSWAHHRLAIPWRGPHGRITALQRRRVEGVRDPKYVLPWAPEWPYGSDVAAKAPDLLLVEGAFDCVAARLLGRGRVDVIGIPGIGSWRREWASLVAGRRVLVGLDRGKPRADGVIPEDRAAARIALDCAGRFDEEPNSAACSICGAAEAWLCEGCGRRRAPPGEDWASLWAKRQNRVLG